MPVSVSQSIPTPHPTLVAVLLFPMSYTRISKRFCSFFLKCRKEKLSLLFPHLTLLHAMIRLVHSPQTFQLFGLIEGIRSVENRKQKLWPKFFMFILSSRKRNTEWNDTHSKAAQSQNDSLGPWQSGPCFRQPEFQLEVREAKNPPASKWLEGCAQLLGALGLLDSPPFTEGLLLPKDRFLASCQVLFKLPTCL